MTEKSLSDEVKARLVACTFADLARAVEAGSRRSTQNPFYARASAAFEALPKSVRKRVAKLNVLDSADLIAGMVDGTTQALVRLEGASSFFSKITARRND